MSTPVICEPGQHAVDPCTDQCVACGFTGRAIACIQGRAPNIKERIDGLANHLAHAERANAFTGVTLQGEHGPVRVVSGMSHDPSCGRYLCGKPCTPGGGVTHRDGTRYCGIRCHDEYDRIVHGVDRRDITPSTDERANRLADENGRLLDENRELKVENSDLRRAVERLERKAGRK